MGERRHSGKQRVNWLTCCRFGDVNT